MLKLRSIGINDYRVLDAGQRIGRIRLADERMPPVWLIDAVPDCPHPSGNTTAPTPD
jgi:hypothetical protein